MVLIESKLIIAKYLDKSQEIGLSGFWQKGTLRDTKLIN